MAKERQVHTRTVRLGADAHLCIELKTEGSFLELPPNEREFIEGILELIEQHELKTGTMTAPRPPQTL